MKHAAEELAEDIAADVKLLLTVCHVLATVACQDPDGIDVAVKEALSDGMGVAVNGV